MLHRRRQLPNRHGQLLERASKFVDLLKLGKDVVRDVVDVSEIDAFTRLNAQIIMMTTQFHRRIHTIVRFRTATAEFLHVF